MKKTFLIQIFKNIKKTKVSFIAITIFITLTIALFLGFRWSSISFEKSIDDHLENFQLSDIEVLFPYGLNDSDIEKMKEVEGVTEVEKAFFDYEFFIHNDQKFQCKISSITTKINQFFDVEGTIPVNPTDIAIEKIWAKDNGFELGDTVTFIHNDDGGTYLLKGIIDRDIDLILNQEPTSDGMKYLKYDTFTITAFLESASAISRFPSQYGISPITNTSINCLMFIPFEAFDEDAFTGFNAALIYCESLRKYISLSEDYSENLQKIVDNLQPCYDEIVANKQEQITGDFDNIVDFLLENVDDFKEKIISYLELILDDKLTGEIREFIDELSKENIESKIDTLKDFLIDAGIYQVVKGYITTRKNNVAINTKNAVTTIVNQLAAPLSVLFLIVSLFVAFSAISRLVYDQTVLIGMEKALGFNRKEITFGYLLYSSLSVIIGSILGLICATFVIEPIFLVAAKTVIIFDSCVLHFNIIESIIVVLIVFISLILTTLLACNKSLKKEAIKLLQGPSLPSGKKRFYEKLQIWKKLPLLTKTIINNAFNDKRRLFSTVVGIAGCTALFVSAFSFKFFIRKSIDTHFLENQSYTVILNYDSNINSAKEEIENLIKDYRYTNVSYLVGLSKFSTEDSFASTIFVSNNSELDDFVNLSSPYDGKHHSVKEGVFINNSLKEEDLFDIGDEITFIDPNNQEYDIELNGFYLSYLISIDYYMSKDAYVKIFGKEPVNNAFLLDINKDEFNYIKNNVSNIEGFLNITDYKDLSYQSFESCFLCTNVILGIYCVLSVALAILFVYNVLSMFILEKKREILTLIVNGYTLKEAKKYIYTDTIFITIISVIIGAVIGSFVGNLLVKAICSGSSYFMTGINFPAILIGVCSTIVLTFIISIFSLQKIKKFDLTSVNN